MARAVVAAYHRDVPRLAALATCALTATAIAQPAQPAPPPAADALPPRVQAAAKAAFDEARAADAAGDRKRAAERYRYVMKIAPHPNVAYNLADVLRRDHDVRGAAAAYRDYLKHAPTARDRAKVEKQIRTLEATPGEVDVTSNDDTAIVFIDGVRQARQPPIFLELPPGPHRFDGFTALSFRSLSDDIDFAREQRVTLTFPPRVDGNLVVSGSGWLGRAKVAIDGDDDFRMATMITATAGERVVEVIHDGCRFAKTVDVPADDILYVYVEVANPKPIGKPMPAPPRTSPAVGSKPVRTPGPVAPPPCPKATIRAERVGPPAP